MTTTTPTQQLAEHGYVVLRGVLDAEQDLLPVEREYATILNGLAKQWAAAGLITATWPELPFCDRLSRLLEHADVAFDRHFDISLPQAEVTEQTPMHTGPAIFRLLRNPRLLDAIEPILGPEIYSNPVQHTRIKLPPRCLGRNSRTDLTGDVAWHQDLAVVTDDADNTELLTVWIPMTRATREMGCMAVVPDSHHQLNLHCPSSNPRTLKQLSIPEQLVDDRFVALPMEPGDVLLMNRRTIHRGLDNVSDQIRWSFDLRYQPTGQPTGREWFPGFVARSRSHPETEMTSHSEWTDAWDEARRRLANSSDPAFNRWKHGDPRCA